MKTSQKSKLEIRDSRFGPQSGVTLVIAMVMLAAVTFISFALSTIIIREIGVARVILQSEPAISGASSGGEVGLFRLFRELAGTAATGQLPGSGAGYAVETDLYDDYYNFSAVAGAEVKVGLYDAEQPDNKHPNPAYSAVTITNGPGNALLQFRVNTWTKPDAVDAICTGSVSANSTSFQCTLMTGTDSRFVIFLQPSGGGNANGRVTAYGTAGQVIGIPSDNQNLIVTGTAGAASRHIEIKVQ